jgi:hypothetical protein
MGAESQKIFGDFGEYMFHRAVDHKFRSNVTDDRIIAMRLPAEDLEGWGKRLRAMFR